MAPGLNHLLDPQTTDWVDGRSPPALGDSEDDEMAQLERTYQQSQIRAGEEVELFGKWLDECTLRRGSPAEKRARIFKLVKHYHEYYQDKANNLRERRRLNKAARGGSTHGTDMDLDEDEDRQVGDDSVELRRWETEAQTWDLLRRLLPLRHREFSPPQASAKGSKAPRSRKQYWDDFLLSDSTASERQAVLKWLQSNASTGPDIDDLVEEFQQKAERGDFITHGWLHTRTDIKQIKRMNAWPHVLDPQNPELSDFSTVTQLDPDAMTRQGRKLKPQDEFFERAIWLGCFELLRRGQSIDEIRDWCLVRTEAWRASAMSALPLSLWDDDDQPNFDPTSVVLWRRMCYALVKQGGTDDFERAVYGLLSGDITSVEKVCKTWDDFLFANYNALLRTQFDSYLIEQLASEAVASIAHSMPAFNALQYHGEAGGTVAKRLVTTLENDKRTLAEAKTVTKAVQGAILANDLDAYFFHQGQTLSSAANEREKSHLLTDFNLSLGLGKSDPAKYATLQDHDSLRIIAHILIINQALKTVDAPDHDRRGSSIFQPRLQTQEHILVSYISFLRLAGLDDMIPLYCSKLSGSRPYSILSRNLIHITDRDDQITKLNLIARLGLDIHTFLQQHPQNFLSEITDVSGTFPAKGAFKILSKDPASIRYGRILKEDFMDEPWDQIQPLDENLIRSIEWLNLDSGLLLDTCEYGIQIYKYFLKHMHLDAARTFQTRAPVVEIIRLKTGKDVVEGSDATWIEEIFADPVAHDQVPDDGGIAEFGASRARVKGAVRNMWELECLVKALDAIETVSGIAQLVRENPDNQDKNLFNELGLVVKNVKLFMKPLLKNWLLFSNEDDDDFQNIREAYLIEAIMGYVSALHFAGMSLSRDFLLECMDLAAKIAQKDSDVAQLFVKTGRMKELVEAFASCSKALAIWTVDHKKGSQTTPKKFRETGWSRELWSVKP